MDLEDLIDAIDIVDYISQFVDLEERGEEFWGLSPFTSEKTPSFSVRRAFQSFYCFSSGIGGNVFTFVKYYFKCSGWEAVNKLKEYAGLNGDKVIIRQKLDATKVCKKYARKEPRKQGGSHQKFPDDYMSKYEKNNDALKVWEDEGISRQVLDKWQVYYDGFSNRLVYPIRNLSGMIVNIGGRTLDKEWKEKGFRKYTYFAKWGGEMDVIYGLYDNLEEILARKEVILFEGCKSVLLADTWGIRNTAAILTSHLSPAQMQILAQIGVRVVFALDKEVSIKDDHNIKRLKKYTEVEYLWDKNDVLEEKMAPVDMGEDIFKTLYQQRLRYH